MKKISILVAILCIALGVIGCSQNNKDFEKQEKNKDGEQKYLTEEEMLDISEKLTKDIEENTKYKFAKIIEVDETIIKVLYTNNPQGYDVNGYNEDLDIDVSKLKDTTKEEMIDLVGVTSNILPENINDVVYVRIGTYEPNKDNEDMGIAKGTIVSVDEIK